MAEQVEAKATYYDAPNDVIEVKVGEHHMTYGKDTGGYCYAHQTFDCELAAEEQAAVDAA